MTDKKLLDSFNVKARWDKKPDGVFNSLGILEYKDCQIHLDVFDNSTNSLENMTDFSTRKGIKNFYGIGEKNVQLQYVFSTGHHIQNRFSSTKYYAQQMFINNDMNSGWLDQQNIKKISFSYPFLWGAYRKLNESEHFVVLKTVNIDEGIKLHTIGSTSSSSGIQEQKKFQHHSFQIEWENPTSVEIATKYMNTFNLFLRFCYGCKPFYPNSVSLISAEQNVYEYYPSWAELLPKIKYPPNIPIPNKYLRYSEIESNFETVIQKWFKLYFSDPNTMFDFFNVFGSHTSIETAFTELCHVIQKFYINLNSDDPNFRSKLEWFLGQSEFADEINTDDFTSKVVDTRDYNVHGNRNRGFVVTDGGELLKLKGLLITLIEACLFNQISATTESMSTTFYKDNIISPITFED